LIEFNLKDEPSRIYNIYEKELNLERKPTKIVTGEHFKTLAVKAGTYKTVTVMGRANALGHQIPPFFFLEQECCQLYWKALHSGLKVMCPSLGGKKQKYLQITGVNL
jgi:hypothetical protein